MQEPPPNNVSQPNPAAGPKLPALAPVPAPPVKQLPALGVIPLQTYQDWAVRILQWNAQFSALSSWASLFPLRARQVHWWQNLWEFAPFSEVKDPLEDLSFEQHPQLATMPNREAMFFYNEAPNVQRDPFVVYWRERVDQVRQGHRGPSKPSPLYSAHDRQQLSDGLFTPALALLDEMLATVQATNERNTHRAVSALLELRMRIVRAQQDLSNV